MRGAGDLAEVAQQLHVGRHVAEVIVADQAAIGLAAELAEFVLVDLLEQRALVPLGVGIEPQIAVQLVLGDVHDADLELRVGLRVEDEIVQAAPGALDLLEFRRVDDLVHLRGELLVDARDHLLDRVEDVVLDDGSVRSASRDQGRDRVLDLGRRALGARLEALLEQDWRIRRLRGLRPVFRHASSVALFAMIALASYFVGLGFRLRRPRFGSGGGARLERLHELRIGEQLLELVFGRHLAVHVAQQVGELLARLEQLRQRRDLAGDRCRAEIVHLVEAQVDGHLLAARRRRACCRLAC